MFDREPVVLRSNKIKKKFSSTTFPEETLLKRERGGGKGVDDSPK